MPKFKVDQKFGLSQTYLYLCLCTEGEGGGILYTISRQRTIYLTSQTIPRLLAALTYSTKTRIRIRTQKLIIIILCGIILVWKLIKAYHFFLLEQTIMWHN